MDFDWVIGGGLACGALAGGAARFGRLCTMSAIEDALVGRDTRGLKAWGLALAVAIAATQALAAMGLVDISSTLYGGPHLHLLGAALGGLMFGLGMTLVGTCGFGLLVRAGAGDLRAVLTALIIGVVAMAATAGVLAPLRVALLDFGNIALAPYGGSSLDSLLGGLIGQPLAKGALAAIPILLVAVAFSDRRLCSRRRLLIGAGLMGIAVAAGWLVTGRAVDALILDRPESLSFVAPVGRALLQVMMQPFRTIGFGVSAAGGVLLASFLVALWRQELRWEAFDDATEMRRHLAGAALMGVGGVLAQGCTIGQGLSAASTLAVSAPIFILTVLAGAKVGLMYLIEGHAIWRLGRAS